jgi:hypothetical protein
MQFIKNGLCDEDESVLICPVCGFEYTHLSAVIQTSSDEGRPGVELQFDCEGGHSFYIDLRNYKGYTIASSGKINQNLNETKEEEKKVN